MDDNALQRFTAAMDLPPAVTPKDNFKKHKVSIPYIPFPLEKTKSLSLSSIYIGGQVFNKNQL